MILTGARAEAFIRRPDPDTLAVLLYGPDRGLIRERADALVGGVGGDLSDPFSVVDLDAATVKGDPARLGDEAASLTFSGRRRIVRIREAGDAVADVLAPWLETAAGGGFVILEAGELAKRSALRRLCEGSPAAAAIGCYPVEGADLERFLAGALSAEGVGADAEALAFLASRLGDDRALARRELEKLIVYMNGGGRISVRDVLACVGDSGSVTLDFVADAACRGERAALDRALGRAFAEGASPIAVLRATARHLQRLLQVSATIARGEPPEKAIASLRPPVFFKLRGSFRRQVSTWSAEAIGTALGLVTDAELDCKTTGMPAEALCERTLMRIANAAGRGPVPRRP